MRKTTLLVAVLGALLAGGCASHKPAASDAIGWSGTKPNNKFAYERGRADETKSEYWKNRNTLQDQYAGGATSAQPAGVEDVTVPLPEQTLPDGTRVHASEVNVPVAEGGE